MTRPRRSPQDPIITNCTLNDHGCVERIGKSDGYCKKCGWDAAEARRRKQMIRYGHMTKDDYGCQRLIVSHEDEF